MLKPTRRRLTLTTIALSTFVILPAAGQTINEDIKLTASDGLRNDLFGNSIDIDNDIIAVGAKSDSNENGFFSGSAYLFDASTGAQQYKLLPKDGAVSDEFGAAIAIDNGIVAVGAPYNDDSGSGSGSAYLFDASTGKQLFKLIPNDGTTGDLFGWSIAIDNGIVAVGAFFDDDNGIRSGSAYIFNASTGTQLFKLHPNDGGPGDRFGRSIAIDNGIVAVGAYHDDDNGDSSGSAYLFDASTGKQLFKLLPSDGEASDWFGYSIAIDNGIVAVGAHHDDDNGDSSGSAYLFDASTGKQLFKLIPNDAEAGDNFGNSIAVDNGVVAAGAARNAGNGSGSGSAYLFNATTGEQIAKLLPSDGSASDIFGISIAIDNSIVAVGSSFDDDNGTDSGSAYVYYTGTGPPCPADLTNDGTLNFFDVSAFLTAFAAKDPVADFTNNGTFNFFDVSAFLQAFAQGCP